MTAEQRVSQLETAIRTHRDQRGDDRCWLDDAELYAVLGEDQATQTDFKLPPRQTFLQNCSRYWECRQKSTDKEDALRQYKGGM